MKATSGSARCIPWEALNLQDRHGLEGLARDPSSVSDLSSPHPTLVEGGHWGHGVWGALIGPQTMSTDPHHRSLHRWHLTKCEKKELDIGPTRKRKGTRITIVTDAAGPPIALRTFGASTHEEELVRQNLTARFMDEPSQVLVEDKAYACDDLDRKLKRRKFSRIPRYRAGRSMTQEASKLRRY